MSNLILTKIHLRNGIWRGRLTGPAAAQPQIEVRHLDQPVPDVALTATGTAGQWDLAVPLPPRALADGVQVFVILDASDQTRLGDFTLIAGEAAAHDLRAEVELLRAEMDMLKRAFRRHCLHTPPP
ncbi:hypothetical protein [Sedimentitalea nanhaiensis]|uniref:Uncharacterized protein n=1 Tax=Sedimentitalea nanhaiensis TaxID=999627 RepID=A0A1I6YTZ6_9RHOB|nr:hypothetical protein [Sedimentitalea nanhaiensis]SFT53975.1 hypothetical protein SAMN05216236_10327 [Sedimentitalea nanhaiensis]